jgi:ABC-type sulfate/molybdate transport systems ATPase subunit
MDRQSTLMRVIATLREPDTGTITAPALTPMTC